MEMMAHKIDDSIFDKFKKQMDADEKKIRQEREKYLAEQKAKKPAKKGSKK